MFKIHNDGCLGLDYDQILDIHKYGIIFKNGEELILPQTLTRQVRKRRDFYVKAKEAVLH